MSKLDAFTDKLSILDGGWGTQFYKLGMEPGTCCERWNLEAPDKVVKVARDYVEAGSDIILTNSFQGNSIALARHGLDDKVIEINCTAVKLSRRAAEGRAKVFASIGPSSKMLMMGEISEDDLLRAFGEQARGLAAGKPDGIVLETFGDIDEWKLAARAVRDHCDLPLVGCLTFDSGPDNLRTMMGTPVQAAISAAEELGLDGVGANCGVGIDAYQEIARLFCEGTKLPVWIKPNAGRPEQQGSQVIYRQTAAEFGQCAKSLVELGISSIGGCCGTTPDHIRELKKALKR